jgi:hypothetical protein
MSTQLLFPLAALPFPHGDESGEQFPKSFFDRNSTGYIDPVVGKGSKGGNYVLRSEVGHFSCVRDAEDLPSAGFQIGK